MDLLAFWELPPRERQLALWRWRRWTVWRGVADAPNLPQHNHTAEDDAEKKRTGRTWCRDKASRRPVWARGTRLVQIRAAEESADRSRGRWLGVLTLDVSCPFLRTDQLGAPSAAGTAHVHRRRCGRFVQHRARPSDVASMYIDLVDETRDRDLG